MAKDMYGKPPPSYRPAFTSSTYPLSAHSDSSQPKPDPRPLNNHGGNSGWFSEYTKLTPTKSPAPPAPAPTRRPGSW